MQTPLALDVNSWLETKAPGFRNLSPDERQAIFHFVLLWSLFEAKALKTHASAKSIVLFVEGCAKQGSIPLAGLETSLMYFRSRYFLDGVPTEHFSGLGLRSNDKVDLVKSVLNNTNNDPAHIVSALLIVVYRFRNNLFHGVKWAYGIGGQHDNFNNANNVLVIALSSFGQNNWDHSTIAAVRWIAPSR